MGWPNVFTPILDFKDGRYRNADVAILHIVCTVQLRGILLLIVSANYYTVS